MNLKNYQEHNYNRGDGPTGAGAKSFTRGAGPAGAGAKSGSRAMAPAAPAILGAALMSLVRVVYYPRTGFKDCGNTFLLSSLILRVFLYE